ncbi:MAG: hypothetical protein Q9160_005164 [Pyrenula sp. 1 TL-2023]
MPSEYRDDDGDGPTRDIPFLTDDETDVESQNRDLHITSDSPASESSTPFPVPVWMRESAKSFKYKWVPAPVRQSLRAVARWVQGPDPPRVMRIKPFFPKIQEAPLRLVDRFVPKRRHRICLLGFVYFCWFLTWSLMVRHNSTAAYIKGHGKPQNLWCGASLWRGNNGCGLNGNDCRPFSSDTLSFRCGANCNSVQLLDPYHVGNKSLVYEGLVIGGPDPNKPNSIPHYRADSFICQAAIHAGVISNEKGGCGVARLTGSQSEFHSSKHHGIRSTSFPASFPRSYTFEHLSTSQASCPTDSRWPLFAITAITLILISLFTTSPAAFFWSTFLMLILHVGLVSDPPNDPTILDLISKLFSRLLPACFIAFILYRYCARPQLTSLTAQAEKTALYLGFAFIGALNNYTFAPLIPIQRLTPHDIKSQPGAPLALALILFLIISIALGQVHFLRVSGLLPRYLRLYLAMVGGLLILVAIPGLRLRIHHYILAILLMPGTALQTRPGLLYQGLLLGLFINGVARWGFASIVQTPAALGEYGGNRGGASWWGARPPNVTATVGPERSNITFWWGELPVERGVDGVSVLVNDVERWRGYVDSELVEEGRGVTMERGRKRWREGEDEEEEAEEPEVEFYRFAWMKGSGTGKYSGVGTWDAKGVWHGIKGKGRK